MILWQQAWAGVHNACLTMWLGKPVCPIIFKIVTNSAEHILSWDSDMVHKQLVNRFLTPFYDTRKLITVVKVTHQWVLAEPQKSCTYFRVLSKRLMLFPIGEDCIFHLRCLSCLIGFNYTFIIGEDRRNWDDEEDVSSCWMILRTQEERGSAISHSLKDSLRTCHYTRLHDDDDDEDDDIRRKGQILSRTKLSRSRKGLPSSTFRTLLVNLSLAARMWAGITLWFLLTRVNSDGPMPNCRSSTKCIKWLRNLRFQSKATHHKLVTKNTKLQCRTCYIVLL
jgi:hypothetical protein